MLTLTLAQLCAVGAASCFILGLIDGVVRLHYRLAPEKRALMVIGFGAGCTSLPRTAVMLAEKAVIGPRCAGLAFVAAAGAAAMLFAGEFVARLF